MKRLFPVMLVTLLLSFTTTVTAEATLESFSFASEAEQQHFRELIAELRCLVCQNQSLADSDAELAHDLRAEVYDLIQQGRSDEEIITFLVDRYGDFVLYKPPMKPSMYLLWFGPFVLLGIAAVLLLKALRRQRQVPVAEISAEQRKRLDAVLGRQDAADREGEA